MGYTPCLPRDDDDYDDDNDDDGDGLFASAAHSKLQQLMIERLTDSPLVLTSV